MSLDTDSVVEAHRNGQVRALAAGLTPDHSQALRAKIAELQEHLRRMPLQLYAQAVALTEVVGRTLCNATLYYVQRHPRELGSFSWIIDGKDINRVTEWERWWTDVVGPLLQSRAIEHPLPMLQGANYSHFRKFDVEAPEGYREAFGVEDKSVLNIGAIVTKNISFRSETDFGLELVDILTNAARRALIGHLQEEGWINLSSLIVRENDRHRISLGTMGKDTPRADGTAPYAHVIRALDQGGRNMLSRKFSRRTMLKPAK